MLAACGGAPSSLELCHDVCNTEKRCGTLSDNDAANCNTDCDNMKGALSDQDEANDKMCKNADEIRSQEGDCASKACNEVDSCVAAVDTTCVVK